MATNFAAPYKGIFVTPLWKPKDSPPPPPPWTSDPLFPPMSVHTWRWVLWGFNTNVWNPGFSLYTWLLLILRIRWATRHYDCNSLIKCRLDTQIHTNIHVTVLGNLHLWASSVRPILWFNGGFRVDVLKEWSIWINFMSIYYLFWCVQAVQGNTHLNWQKYNWLDKFLNLI